MVLWNKLWVNFTLLLCFGRPLLVFLVFVCTLWLMLSGLVWGYVLGLGTLIGAMITDWGHGILAKKYIPDSRLAPVVDRMMDRLVASIVFPLLAAGMVWRYALLERLGQANEVERLHMVFVLGLSVLVLVRDQLVQFLRNISQRVQEEGEFRTLGRWRMLAFYPMAVLIYGHAFWSPAWQAQLETSSWLEALPIRMWFLLEIGFLILCVASVTLHLRLYTSHALARITGDDKELRRRILSVIPNSFTLLNATLGISAVVFTSFGLLREATLLLMGAGLFDRLDGMVARRLGLADHYGTRRLGVVLDDVSDAISFCFAPAAIFYMTLFSLPEGRALGWWVPALAIFYASAGILRLVMFTLDSSPVEGFFKGMPTLGGAGMVMAPLVVLDQADATLLGLNPQSWILFCILGLLAGAVMMNSYSLHYPHIGRFFERTTVTGWVLGMVVLAGVWTPYFGFILLGLALFYLCSPLISYMMDALQALLKQRAAR